jgi:hypothetical protein
MSALYQNLIALGSNATVLIVLGFLARSLMQSFLAKDIKKFETELQNSATALAAQTAECRARSSMGCPSSSVRASCP